MKAKPNKPMPSFVSDVEAEQFVETADLSTYDLSGFKPMHFEFEPKTAALNMRHLTPLGTITRQIRVIELIGYVYVCRHQLLLYVLEQCASNKKPRTAPGFFVRQGLVT